MTSHHSDSNPNNQEHHHQQYNMKQQYGTQSNYTINYHDDTNDSNVTHDHEYDDVITEDRNNNMARSALLHHDNRNNLINELIHNVPKSSLLIMNQNLEANLKNSNRKNNSNKSINNDDSNFTFPTYEEWIATNKGSIINRNNNGNKVTNNDNVVGNFTFPTIEEWTATNKCSNSNRNSNSNKSTIKDDVVSNFRFPTIEEWAAINNMNRITNGSKNVTWEDITSLKTNSTGKEFSPTCVSVNANTVITTSALSSSLRKRQSPDPFLCTNISIGYDSSHSGSIHGKVNNNMNNYMNGDQITNDKISMFSSSSLPSTSATHNKVTTTIPPATTKVVIPGNKKIKITKTNLQKQMDILDTKIRKAAMIELNLLDQFQFIREKRLRMIRIHDKMKRKLNPEDSTQTNNSNDNIHQACNELITMKKSPLFFTESNNNNGKTKTTTKIKESSTTETSI